MCECEYSVRLQPLKLVYVCVCVCAVLCCDCRIEAICVKIVLVNAALEVSVCWLRLQESSCMCKSST